MSENGLKDILYGEGDIIASENGVAPKKVGPRANCPSCPPLSVALIDNNMMPIQQMSAVVSDSLEQENY